MNINKKNAALKFIYLFSVANTIIFYLIGLKFLFYIFESQTLFVTSFVSYESFFNRLVVVFVILCTYLSHFALLAFLPALVLLPFALIIPRQTAVMAVMLWSGAVILLFFDVIFFTLFHFHLQSAFLLFLFNKDYPLFDFIELSSKETVVVYILIFSVFAFEALLAWFIVCKVKLQQKWFYPKSIAISLMFCLYVSYFCMLYSIAHHNNIFAQQTPNLPLYNNILSAILPGQNSLNTLNRASETRFALPKTEAYPLHYPQQPLQYVAAKTQKNILIIAIDSWRFDALNSVLTPNIDSFSRQSMVFNQHFSGGNSTQAGLFALFYSLPSNYWQSMLEQKRGSVLIQALLQQKYDIEILFSSAMIPPFHRTIFVELKNIRTTAADGATIPDRDRHITQEFLSFIENRTTSKPFFAFLFYDAAHGYYKTQNIPKIFPTSDGDGERFLGITSKADLVEVMNRYKNAIHFVDSEIEKVLSELRSKQLLENTIIIITSDHGEEFDDNHKQYIGHGSNYSRYQIQVPFIIYWPDKKPNILQQATSHYDIVPTLMHDALGYTNSASDFSLGENLFANHHRPYLIVGSYLNRAIISNQQIFTLLTSGDIEMSDLKLNNLPMDKLDLKIVHEALHDMRRFHQ